MHGRIDRKRQGVVLGAAALAVLLFLAPFFSVGLASSRRAELVGPSVAGPGFLQSVRVRVGRWVIDRDGVGGQPISISVHLSGVDLSVGEAPSTPLEGMAISSVDVTFSLAGSGEPAWAVTFPDNTRAVLRGRGSLAIHGTAVFLNGTPVDGPLVFHATRATGRRPLDERPETGWAISAIATVDVEDYIAGVLPSEMPLSWPLEALKAQAVAARSYLLAKIRERENDRSRFFDVEATVEDQRYESVASMKLSLRQRRQLEAAVSGTRRLVLVRPGTTQTVSAHFHADCGGTTERASSVWMASAEAAPRPETITGCPVRSARSWGRYISLEEIASVFGRTATGLRSVVVLARNESGRVERVRLVDDAGRSHLVTGAQFRMRLGHDRIRSTRFELREVRREGAVVGAQVTGVGAGHGVGLCQRGAAGLARMGRTHREILRHYYPDAELWEGRSASVSPKKP